MRIDNDPKLDFDDVLIRPKRSEAPSRASVVLQREYKFLNSGATWKGIPIVASNMDTVGTMAMAKALGPEMMTCLHKYYSEERLIDFFGNGHHRTSTFFTLGIKDDGFDKLRAVKAKVGYSLCLRRCGERLHQVLRGTGQADPGDVPGNDHLGGECRHAGYGPGTPDLGSSRHREDRHWSWERLYDPRDDRRRLSPAFRDHRVRRMQLMGCGVMSVPTAAAGRPEMWSRRSPPVPIS